MSAIPAIGVPPVDPTQLPAGVRNGTLAAKSAYQTALGFEQILVDQLSKELAATASGSSSGDGSGDGSVGGSGDGSAGAGLMGSDPANSAYAQLLPTALTSAIMSGGGTGIAQQLAATLDPSTGTKR